MPLFITIRFWDILDIFLVAILIFQVYRIIRGTAAFNIMVGLLSLYLLWILVKALDMELLEMVMGQFIGIGVLALVIVFHPEIRKFLIFIGRNYNFNRLFSFDKLFRNMKNNDEYISEIDHIVEACNSMAKSKTGALIVITKTYDLSEQINTGETINARISSTLIRSIFFKNSPLHDGAVIISNNKIVAAGCILPLTQKEIDKELGLRHRAAIGISEISDAIIIVVSEETGLISLVKGGRIDRRLSTDSLRNLLSKNLI